jgi:hypothetical protein
VAEKYKKWGQNIEINSQISKSIGSKSTITRNQSHKIYRAAGYWKSFGKKWGRAKRSCHDQGAKRLNPITSRTA